jgi:hypothetical protein
MDFGVHLRSTVVVGKKKKRKKKEVFETLVQSLAKSVSPNSLAQTILNHSYNNSKSFLLKKYVERCRASFTVRVEIGVRSEHSMILCLTHILGALALL